MWSYFNDIQIIKYYRYKSVIIDEFQSYKFSTVGFNDKFFLLSKKKKKNDLMIYYQWFKEKIKDIKKANPNLHLCTNKIVFECLTKNGNKFFIGWYDGVLSFGLGRRGDSYIKAKKLKQYEKNN